MNAAEISRVHLTQDRLGFELKDGRLISVPLAFYPTLQHATEAERLNYEIFPFSVHWPDLDCDIGVEGILAGAKELPAYAGRSAELRELKDSKGKDASASTTTLAEAKKRYGIP
jgi:uncharacterized protein DUF2442